VADISRNKMDFFIKVERKSRKASDESTLYMIMNKDGENALAKMETDDISRAKSFLNDMLPEVEAADLEIRIKNQEETVARAEKKLSNLKNDQISLEKKLSDNKTDQEVTQKDIEAQKQALGVLMGKRKSN
jgi:predicted  nucleic acid-binding Zn-ribbon protein